MELTTETNETTEEMNGGCSGTDYEYDCVSLLDVLFGF